jgi:OFA family oxalate/formate antiporter-like MFS transporter
MATEQKVRNRWLVVVGALLIQLALGTIYSWGTMTVFVSPYLNTTMNLDPTIVKEVTVYIFGVGLLTFAITMIFAGKLQQKYGPKKIAILGGILIGIGLLLSAFMTTFIGLLITYGVIFGAGIGFGYVCPIASAGKWFPDKKGFINGIAVAGFGAGAFVFNYVIKALANPTGLSDEASNFVEVISPNIPLMFVVLGIIYVVLVIGGAMTLSNPPEGWKPDGWTPPPPSEESGISGLDFKRGQTVKLPQFWMLWTAFALSAMSGLMVIGSFSAFAKTLAAPDDFLYAIGTSDFVLIGSLAALFNGLGRIVWGKLADMITYKKSMLVMFLIQAILMFIYFTTNGSEIYFLIITCAIFFCFGGNFSLFPTATADLFGSKNLGPNYGIVFTAYGVAGFIGAVGVNLFVSIFGSYLILFIVMGLMSVGSAILAFVIKPPKQR